MFNEGVPLGAAFEVGVGEVKEKEPGCYWKELGAFLEECRFNCALGTIEGTAIS